MSENVWYLFQTLARVRWEKGTLGQCSFLRQEHGISEQETADCDSQIGLPLKLISERSITKFFKALFWNFHCMIACVFQAGHNFLNQAHDICI